MLSTLISKPKKKKMLSIPRPYSPRRDAAEEALGLHYPHVRLFESPGKELFASFIEDEEHFVAPESYVSDRNKKALRRTAVATVESLCSNCSDAMIPYLAMTYFDRFLSRRGAEIPNVAEGKEKLFAICCVTLAWKLRTKGFELSYFLKEKGVLKDYQIQNVADMELLICRGLNSRMQSLTPFSFIRFYTPFLRCPPNVPLPSRLVHNLIIRSQCDIAFTEIRPSVLAACAVIIVSSKVLPRQHDFFELKITTDIEPLRLQRNMVRKCIKMLGPLYSNPPICKPMDFPINPPAEAVHQLPNPQPETSSSQAQPAADEEATGVDYHKYDVERVLMDFELGWDEWLTECEVDPALMDFEHGCDEWLTECEMRAGSLQRPWISGLSLIRCCVTSPPMDAKTSNGAEIGNDARPTSAKPVPPGVHNGNGIVEDFDAAEFAAEFDRHVEQGRGVEEAQGAQEGPEGAQGNEGPALEGNAQGTEPRRRHLLLCATFTPAFSEISAIVEQFLTIGEVTLVCSHNAMRFINFNREGVQVYSNNHGWTLHEDENRTLSQELISWADDLIVCPLSPNTLAKIALGLCNNLVTTIIKEFPFRYIMVPDILESAWVSTSNRACFNLLKQRGVCFMGNHPDGIVVLDEHAGPMTRDYRNLVGRLKEWIEVGYPPI